MSQLYNTLNIPWGCCGGGTESEAGLAEGFC